MIVCCCMFGAWLYRFGEGLTGCFFGTRQLVCVYTLNDMSLYRKSWLLSVRGV